MLCLLLYLNVSSLLTFFLQYPPPSSAQRDVPQLRMSHWKCLHVYSLREKKISGTIFGFLSFHHSCSPGLDLMFPKQALQHGNWVEREKKWPPGQPAVFSWAESKNTGNLPTKKWCSELEKRYEKPQNSSRVWTGNLLNCLAHRSYSSAEDLVHPHMQVQEAISPPWVVLSRMEYTGWKVQTPSPTKHPILQY